MSTVSFGRLIFRRARCWGRTTVPANRRLQTHSCFLSRKDSGLVNTQQSRGMVVVTKTKVDDLSNGDFSSAEVERVLSSSPAAQTDERLVITEACWNRIHTLADKRKDEDVYLRVFVDAGGCSGFSYQFEFETETPEDDDIVFDDGRGARLIVDEGSLDILKGSTIDFVQEMIKSSFEVRDNPQSESACGCGSSFALKNFAANPAAD